MGVKLRNSLKVSELRARPRQLDAVYVFVNMLEMDMFDRNTSSTTAKCRLFLPILFIFNSAEAQVEL